MAKVGKRGRAGEALVRWFSTHDFRTGAQTRGPVWRGPLPRRPAEVDWFAIPAETFEHNKEVDERRHPRLAFMPDSALGKLLATPGVARSLRRSIVSAVQAPDTPRRARLQRRIQRELAAIGV